MHGHILRQACGAAAEQVCTQVFKTAHDAVGGAAVLCLMSRSSAPSRLPGDVNDPDGAHSIVDISDDSDYCTYLTRGFGTLFSFCGDEMVCDISDY
eukprot:6189887-Pleurochrysis_carterae.AAC.5